MARSRSHVLALARLLDDSGAALYAVDDRRELVYISDALATWLGFEVDELLGGVCNYTSSSERTIEAARAALCPPPDVLAGARRTSLIQWPVASGEIQARPVEFTPLPGADGVTAGVLAIVAGADQEHAQSSDYHPHGIDQLHQLVSQHRRELASRFTVDHLIGASPAIARVRSQVLLASSAKTNVLIVGAEGAGKQHVAKTIHYRRGGERPGTLLPLDCAALDPELLVSSLTAAIKSPGVKLQPPATILLNHIDRVSSEAQRELVTLLKAAASLASLTATSTRPLEPLVAEGLVRRDLACLLGTMVLELPRLADRLDDLPLLAQAFVEQINAEGRKQVAGMSPETVDLLAVHPWRRNLSELAEVVRQAHAAAASHLIAPLDLPKQIRLTADAQQHSRRAEETIELPAFLAQIERELIDRALARSKGNKSRAAHLLGLTRPRLYRRMVQLGMVDHPDFKQADD
jgi:DNA-binding NtrC family response regulator